MFDKLVAGAAKEAHTTVVCNDIIFFAFFAYPNNYDWNCVIIIVSYFYGSN